MWKLLMCVGKMIAFHAQLLQSYSLTPAWLHLTPLFAFCSNYAFATTNFSPFLELLSSFISPWCCNSCFCHLKCPFSPLHWLNLTPFLRSNINASYLWSHPWMASHYRESPQYHMPMFIRTFTKPELSSSCGLCVSGRRSRTIVFMFWVLKTKQILRNCWLTDWASEWVNF